MATSSLFDSRVKKLIGVLEAKVAEQAPPTSSFLDAAIADLDVNMEEESDRLHGTVLDLCLEVWNKSHDGLARTPQGIKAFTWLLDVAIDSAKRSQCDAVTPFVLLEQCIDTTPIAHCEALWDVLESRKDQLTLPVFLPASGRNTKSKLALLRIANSLLRRLSNTQNTVFCGRILMFLAYVYPLSERSGVNVTGTFNVANVTKFDEEGGDEAKGSDSGDKDVDMAGAGSSAPVDRQLHRALWRLQAYMIQPVKATASADAWGLFLAGLDTVLSAFEAQKLEKGASEEPAGSDAGQAATASASSDEFYCVKYLTNSSLLPLQLRDAQLRRHVLLQVLILAQYLPRAKTQPAGVNVSDALKKPVARVWRLLKETPPQAAAFAATVKLLLEREVHWARWKDETKCAPFEREFVAGAKKAVPGTGGRAPRVAMGTKVWLSRVAGQDYLDVAAKMVKGRRPDLEDYLTPYREAADPENCIEDQYNPKHNKMYVWKGQRLLATEHLQLMSEAPPPFDELIAKLDAKLAKAKAASTGTAAPPPGAAAAAAAADAPPPAANGADTTAAAKDEAGGSGSKRTERDEGADAGEQPANGDASKPPRPAKRARTGDAEA